VLKSDVTIKNCNVVNYGAGFNVFFNSNNNNYRYCPTISHCPTDYYVMKLLKDDLMLSNSYFFIHYHFIPLIDTLKTELPNGLLLQ